MENIEAAMKRIPPHSIEAEQAVLGAMLMNKEAVMVASEIISGEDFYQTAYGILFDAMVELFHKGKPIDLITLQEHLKEKDVPPEVSSMESVDMTAPYFPNRKNATKKSGTLSMMRKIPEFHPVPSSSSTAMPLTPPGAKSFGVTKI